MVDFTRMKQGGAMAQFFAMFLLPPGAEKMMNLDKPVDDEDYIMKLSSALKRNVEANSDIIAMAHNADELLANDKAGKMSAFLTIEDGRSVNGSFENLQRYYDMGVRLISLTWNFKNCFGSPNSKDPVVMAEGLTDFGKEAVVWMQEKGMLVDVSHLSDAGFWDLIRMAHRPIVASHSNARAVCPHGRNLTDDMFRAVRDSGGVVGINYYKGFVGGSGDLDALAQHIEHFLALDGEKTLCFGSDFDGCDPLTDGITGLESIPGLYAFLRQRGYSEDLLEDLFWNNLRRMFD